MFYGAYIKFHIFYLFQDECILDVHKFGKFQIKY